MQHRHLLAKPKDRIDASCQTAWKWETGESDPLIVGLEDIPRPGAPIPQRGERGLLGGIRRDSSASLSLQVSIDFVRMREGLQRSGASWPDYSEQAM
jgi:hypothetical protein